MAMTMLIAMTTAITFTMAMAITMQHCNVNDNMAIARATWQRQHGTWQHIQMATFEHGNIAMAT